MNKKQLTFLVFIINKYALATKQSVIEVYHQLEKLQLLDNYLIRHFDVLHTLGENYLAEDLKELVALKSEKK